ADRDGPVATWPKRSGLLGREHEVVRRLIRLRVVRHDEVSCRERAARLHERPRAVRRERGGGEQRSGDHPPGQAGAATASPAAAVERQSATSVITRASATITSSAARRPGPGATPPMMIGPTIEPRYPIVTTRPRMTPVAPSPVLPAALNAIGTTGANPTPSSAKPAIAAAGVSIINPKPRPTAAMRLPTRTSATGPNRACRPSLAKRPAAIVNENAASAVAANPGLVCRLSRR